MADTPVYIIVNLAVTDAPEYRIYEKGFFGLLKKHGGSFTLEGDTPREDRMIIFSFPSESIANAWYADPEYQALSEHRRAGTKLDFLTMVHGLPPRD
jgi:uncharacterized protein (DUF1330 family)